MKRREFIGKLGIVSLGGVTVGKRLNTAVAQSPGEEILGAAGVETSERPKGVWQSVSDRKIRVGIVGYGVCRFGAAFGFQDHPNVEVIAVSDLIPERCRGLMRACRCDKSYESLEVLVKDPKIEAVFVATDAPSHARHCIEVLKHGKHVMTAVPAVFGSLEEAAQLLETVKKTGLRYMMAETSCYREGCYAMRQVYRAGGFGRLVYSEGEYFHYMVNRIGSYKNWRVGLPPQWYPTHSTAYYVCVTGKRLTAVSCVGFRGRHGDFQPDANGYDNPFTDEIALFRTSEGGSSRIAISWSVQGYGMETGRVFGELGSMNGTEYKGSVKTLPNIERLPLPPGVATGGHGGSHGHLTNEFITAILEDREPLVNVYEALAMTVPGIVAHRSALKGGELLKVPQYDSV